MYDLLYSLLTTLVNTLFHVATPQVSYFQVLDEFIITAGNGLHDFQVLYFNGTYFEFADGILNIAGIYANNESVFWLNTIGKIQQYSLASSSWRSVYEEPKYPY
jgi:hypothetical protein